jgi:hypothetical protein
LNSRLFAVLLAVLVLSLTYAAAAPVKVPYAEINSVGSVDPYVEIGVPFEIDVVGCVAADSFAHYGFYIEHTAGYVPWPPGLIPGDKSTILYGSGWGKDTGNFNINGVDKQRLDCDMCPLTNADEFTPEYYGSGRPPAKVNVTLYEIGRVGLRLVVMHADLETWHKNTMNYNRGQTAPLGNILTTRDFEVTVVKSLPDVKI